MLFLPEGTLFSGPGVGVFPACVLDSSPETQPEEKTMSEFSGTIQNADWKTEKHVPVIEAPDAVKAGEFFTVTAGLGKAIAHPNTVQHYIAWISLYFLPAGAKLPIQLAHAEFKAHGDSTADQPGPALTNPSMTASIQLAKPGTLQAVAYCNIHGVWQSAKAIQVEA
jgi:superoxide reductase